MMAAMKISVYQVPSSESLCSNPRCLDNLFFVCVFKQVER